MPHVASQASVLKPQPPGLTSRERADERQDATSPFAMLLAETSADVASGQRQAERAPGAVAALRNHGQRGEAMRSEHSQRPQRDGDCADAAPEAGATAVAPDEPEAAAAEPFQIGAAGQAADAPAELSPQPAAVTEDTADGHVDTTGGVHAAVIETPPPMQSPVTDTSSRAPAPVESGIPSETDAIEPTATVPGSALAAAAPDPGAAAIAPATVPPPASQDAQAVEGSDPTPQQTRTAATSQARPSILPTAAIESASQPSTTAPEAVMPAASTAALAHGESESAPKPTAQAGMPSQPSPRLDTSDTPDRPQTGSATSDFVHANQPTPDSSHVAHLQSGRDFGQMVAAAAHEGADASNLLVSAPVPLESLAVEIATRAQSGRNRFEIRLDPPELGRIDVRLDIDRSGNVTSRLVVEKAETLDVLRRDAHQLERALQDAGLKTSDNGLQFSLRDQSFAGQGNQDGSNAARTLIADPELPAADGAPMAYGLAPRGGRGIDIRV